MRVIIVFSVLTGALAGCTLSHSAIPVVSQKASVSTRKVQAADLSDVLSYPARVSPKVSTVVLAESDGVVGEVRTPLGQSVHAKERLLKIQHTDPVYRYAPVWVISPVDGVVSSVEVNQGSYVTRGQKLATVTDPTQVRITVEVPASDLSYVTKGAVGEFRLPGRDAAVSVAVHGVSPFVDPATGTASCELEITSDLKSGLKTNEGAAHLAAGLIGQVSFQINQRKGIAVPEQAIIYRGKDPFIRVLRDGRAYKVAVTLGQRLRDRFEVLKGLEDGATIIERTTKFVNDGDEVQVKDQ